MLGGESLLHLRPAAWRRGLGAAIEVSERVLERGPCCRRKRAPAARAPVSPREQEIEHI
ncbi:MAG TPA: hypothetical protein VGX46_07340 [Vicinamibacterales bacterium]|nr:hypothetical protein [Vicinamibacterales bacterium]